MDEFTANFDFEELHLNGYGEGILLAGTAELSADQEPGQFYISAIKLGPKWLTRTNQDGRDGLDGQLFHAISVALYAMADVETFYAERYAEFNNPSFDHVYDAKREREIL